MVIKTEHTALYKQVYEYMLTRIKTGEWEKGRKLPSVRSLAELLGVHRLTILKAYQLLKEEGYVYAKDKTGYYCKDSIHQSETGEMPALHSYIQNSNLSEIHREPTFYKFSAAVIDPTLLPNRYLSQHVKEIFDRYPHLLGTYAPVKGDEELIVGLSAYFQKYDKMYIDEDSIIVTSGAQQGIDIIAKVFVQAHDYVLIESPTYSGATDIFVNRGARLISVPITAAGFCLNEVESLMKKYKPKLFYTNPTHHNPTGYTVPVEQRKQLAELAEKYQCIILEDDSFHEIYFQESPPPPIYAYDIGGYVIYLRSFCKYMAPGLRICAMVAHPSLVKWLIKGKALADNGTPLLNQKAFLFYLTSERIRSHMEKLRIALQIRKETMEEALKNHFIWDSPSGGLNLWVRINEEVNKGLLKNRALASSISYVPGYICDPHERDIPYIRLSYSFLNEQEIKNGLQKLTSIYDTLSKERG
ncbi:PLP-dependent aminotransferase family protein [Bacillus sp. B1-b2]|uniref:aminotransferase-like domain-containing protein n=1 Tax=Bacillus sp. B1-b2 TaxID=2653201 RepID=UPI00126145BA|nr:PLP-dependent aminotransferase family protein [Bacillus sp. B1-b2]KAB7667178.1 PLP-dependent aminotransferase family protein [Bacillus sp. B1-b2]